MKTQTRSLRQHQGRDYIRSVGVVRCYRDRVEVDNSNRMFYVYYLGRYRNLPTYHYGESLDLSITDFNLRKVLPVYERKIYIPVDHHVNGKDLFDRFVQKNDLRVVLPVYGMENLDVISPTEKCTFDCIVSELNNIFQIIEV